MSQNISNSPVRQYQQYQLPQNPNFAATPNAASPLSDKGVVQNNPLLSAAAAPPENPLVFAGSAAASTAALLGINNYINNPLQTNTYDATFFKKVETFVDKYASNPKVTPFIDKLKGLKNWTKTQANKSEILRTLFTKPSLGGPQVSSQAAGAKGHLANRALEIMRKYKEANPSFTEFDAILKKAGKDSYKYYDDIIKAINGSSAELTKVMSKRPWWGLGLIKNKASLQEILNKNILVQNYKGVGKTVGQKTAGYLLRGTECLTNGAFSGKGAVIIQAFMVAQSLSEASKAEKGEKFSTFMASLMELMAFMATMGIQMRVVNSLAGLKYIGMSPENVKKFQKAMQIANQAQKYGNHKTYAKMTMYMDSLKNAAKANTKWYQKPFKALGNLISIGRIKETLKPLKSSKIATAFAKLPYGLKVGVGYAGRVALVMGVVIPIFSGVAKKISYSIFGKPVKTMEREKQKEEAEKLKAEQEQMQLQNQQPAQNTAVQPNQQIQQTTSQPSVPGDLVNRLNNQYHNQPQTPAIGAQSMSQATPAASSVKPPEIAAGIRRSYMPNPILGQENFANPASSRSAQIDAIMRQADIAEAQAQKYL